ncbi:valine--tRNA ligase [Candidatus Parcubacteria bacterium]|nr:valine--tRNA ligase [Patescibacteria group bacterium]MBU4309541.1 valine--tRNA ligase [Patescibacteria group bacterium]MBU4432529.1 valine--tRNA ligase [Patescibacteria group bacterium]MBU4578071.1 valine--tRNA ligase [Patescibacteria group bacterium]MCG2696421.1 valine--tRNA ligase [Candidatus Parcubacteria bacterium]
MSELPKAYDPSACEDGIYKKWEESGFFNPDNLDLPADAPTYTIVLPPPNITAQLHLGHSAMFSIEDLLIRYHRMRGYRALWIPGTDHAAIATQNVVEKKLLKEQGLTRHQLGREKLIEHVWEFLRETQATILHQARKMGSSMDWSREAFTLDEQREKAVRKLFVDMYNEGVIYKGERIVNWCPRCKSTLADDEMEYKNQSAKIYTFKYSEDFPFTIATTRPETKLGDTAVAVNPKDERYKQYIGQTFEVDFCGQPLELKIIADWEVDMEFGTGALGVTPAHSMVDWKMAENNDLAIIKVINEEGKIHDGFGEYSGKTVLEAREMVVAELKKRGLLVSEEEMDNNLSVCYRCDTAIEPLPSKQWFVDVDKKLDRLGGLSMKEKAILVAQEGEIKFVPHRFAKRYMDWMNNLHNWCISRQIWFGHRIPAWYRTNNEINSLAPAGEGWGEGQTESVEIYVGIEKPEGEGWTQDEDSLDTWFSSGMWTFSTLGWPDTFANGVKSGDLQKFHPTQVLNTGYEILTLWVSRMIMMSLFAVGEIPFETVYLHGMILDNNGKKMSKSKGNGIDPIIVIDKFGTDAVRLSLLIGSTPGNDTRIGEDKIESYRNFVNKLWNVSRYVISSYDIQTVGDKLNFENLTLWDKWILSELRNVASQVEQNLVKYEFSLAAEEIKRFTVDVLADWYLEVSKFEKNPEKNIVLNIVLRDLLRLWHPFIPFVTEYIWEYLGNEKMLMIDKYPDAQQYDKEWIGFSDDGVNDQIKMVQEVITSIRNARSENKVEPTRKVKAVIYAGDKLEMIKAQAVLIKSLRTGIEDLEIVETGEELSEAIYVVVGDVKIYLLGAIDKEKEQARINKEIERLEKFITALEGKLKNKEFVDKAPKEVVEKEQMKLAEVKVELENLKK